MTVQTALDASRYACGLGLDRCDARAHGLLAPGGLKIVGGCNALRKPLLLAMCRVETYGDTSKQRCRYKYRAGLRCLLRKMGSFFGLTNKKDSTE